MEEYEEEINEQRFKNACRAEALDLEKVAKMQVCTNLTQSVSDEAIHTGIAFLFDKTV